MKRALALLPVAALLALLARAVWSEDAAVSVPLIHAEDGDFVPAGAFLRVTGLPHQWNPTTRRLVIRAGEKSIAASTETMLVTVADRVVQLPRALRFVDGELALPRELVEQVVAREAGLAVTFVPAPARRTSGNGPPLRPIAVRTVAIDPGHGGQDLGAVSPDGVAEKDVVLSVARRLADLLEREAGVRVVLTRTADEFVPLARRTRIANEAGADLFVSIHANADRGRGSSGIETYYLSFDPSDEEARAMALAENRSIGLEDPAAAPGGNLDDLKLILWDLVRTEHLAESARLAEALQDRLCRATGARNRGVRQAPLFVLMGTEMPAVLAEIGFLSHRQEAAALTRPERQAQLARAIYDALLGYDAAFRAREGTVSPRPTAGTVR